MFHDFIYFFRQYIKEKINYETIKRRIPGFS